MLFNSLQYVVFLPIVFVIYWIVPHKVRWVWLLCVSYYFYMSWNPKYVILILFTTVVSYFTAIIIDKLERIRIKRMVLGIATIACLGMLFFFKYFNFVSESIVEVFELFSIRLNPYTLTLLLPVGISFYTFQTLSYVIDVYRGKVPAERHFGIYATFISFFPQLVAGPIERTSNLLPQIKEKHKFDYFQATFGLKQMAWGYFKKIVIADTISQYIGKVFENPQGYHGFSLFISAALFSIQIYCDFSGYSDIAVGTAKLLGVKLMTNFKSPYFSRSLREFWSRWHISLSTWFRDYVYIPLGGSRVGKVRNALNRMVTFLMSGLWHGANWTFVIWGGIHGLGQILENMVYHKKDSAGNNRIICFLRVIVVFSFCTFAWIFFASNSISDAIYIICNMFDGISHPASYLHGGGTSIGLEKTDLLFLTISLLILLVFDFVALKNDVIMIISSKRTFIRWLIYIVFLLWILFNLPATDATEFIYFQF